MDPKEIYYKIEDKWFETIDFLDRKGIPSYKAVDPLEKRGIPSLPVYLAIIIILLAFAIPGLMGVMQPEEPVEIEDPDEVQIPIEVIDTDEMEELEEAEVKAILEGEITEEQITNQEGLANLLLPPEEEYNITATKEGCTNDSTIIKAQADRETPETLKIDCGFLLGEEELEICFDQSAKRIEYIPIQEGRFSRPDLGEECGTGKCRFEPEEGFEYEFKSVDSEYETERSYNIEELKEKSPSRECISMENVGEQENETDDEDDEELDKKMGELIFIVESEEDEERIGGKTVQLVYPNATEEVIEEGTTKTGNGTKGEVTFDLPVNTTYYPEVLPDNQSGGRLFDSYEREVEEETRTEILDVPTHEQTTIQVIDEETEEGINNALIKTEINNRWVELPETDSTGITRPHLEMGKEHTAAVFHEDYLTDNIEKTITGGESATIELEEAEPADVSNIILTLYTDTDTSLPVKEAQIDLKHQDGTHTGRPTKETNEYGEVTFKSVEEGDYCFNINWDGKEYQCGNYPVEVTDPHEQSTITKTYRIEPRMRSLTVDVIKEETKDGVGGATVEVKDANHEEHYGEKDTPETGRSRFDIIQGREAEVSVEAEVEGEQYQYLRTTPTMDDDYSMNFTLDTPLNNTIQFNQITRGGGEATQPIAKSQIYQAEIDLGLEGMEGQRWDEIEANIKTDPEIFLYNERNIRDRDGWELERNADNEQTIEIGKNIEEYDGHENVVTLEIPFIIGPTWDREGNHGEMTIEHEAEWIHEDTDTEITEADEEKIEVSEGGEGEEIGDFFVIKSIQEGEIEDPDAGGWKNPYEITATPGETYTAKYDITNLVEEEYTGDITIEENPDLDRSLFLDSTAELIKVDQETEELETDLNIIESILTVEVPEHEPMEQHDKVAVLLNLEPRFPNADVYLESDDVGELNFEVGGETEIEASLTEESKYDITDKIEIEIIDKETEEPLHEYLVKEILNDFDSKITGDLDGCGGEINLYDDYEDYDEGKITVELDEWCRLEEGEIEISLNSESINSVEFTENIERAVEYTEQPPRISFLPTEGCTINIEPTTEENPTHQTECREDQDAQVKIPYREESGLSSNDIKIIEDSVEIDLETELFEEIVSEESIRIRPDEDADEDEIEQTQASFEINMDLEAEKGEISQKYPYTIPEVIITPRVQGIGMRFLPDPITEYNTDEEIDCSENYCNIEQLIKYLIEDEDDVSLKTGKHTVNLVDQGKFTASGFSEEVRNITKEKTGEDIAVWMRDIGEVDELPTNPTFLTPDPESFENLPGGEEGIFGKFEVTIVGEGIGEYEFVYYIKEFERKDDPDEFEIQYPTHLALYLPFQENPRYSTGVKAGDNVDENHESIDNLKEGIAGLWNVDENKILEEPVSPAGTEDFNHQMIAGICPENDPEHTYCQILNRTVGDRAEAVIHRPLDEYYNIYVVAENEEALKNITESFKETMERRVPLLSVVNPEIPEEGGLTPAPTDINFYCYDGDTECVEEEGDIYDQMVEIEEEIGIDDPEPVRIDSYGDIHPYGNQYIVWEIVQCGDDLENCGETTSEHGQVNPYIDKFKTEFNEYGGDVKIPEGGMIINDLETGIRSVYIREDESLEQTASEIMERYNFREEYAYDEQKVYPDTFREDIRNEESFSRIYHLEDDDTYDLPDIYMPEVEAWNGPDPITTDSTYLVTKEVGGSGTSVSVEPIEIDDDGTKLDITMEEVKETKETQIMARKSLNCYDDYDEKSCERTVSFSDDSTPEGYDNKFEIDDPGTYNIEIKTEALELKSKNHVHKLSDPEAHLEPQKAETIVGIGDEDFIFETYTSHSAYFLEEDDFSGSWKGCGKPCVEKTWSSDGEFKLGTTCDDYDTNFEDFPFDKGEEKITGKDLESDDKVEIKVELNLIYNFYQRFAETGKCLGGPVGVRHEMRFGVSIFIERAR